LPQNVSIFLNRICILLLGRLNILQRGGDGIWQWRWSRGPWKQFSEATEIRQSNIELGQRIYGHRTTDDQSQ
jgi:hypothetical protein